MGSNPGYLLISFLLYSKLYKRVTSFMKKHPHFHLHTYVIPLVNANSFAFALLKDFPAVVKISLHFVFGGGEGVKINT